MQQQETSLKNLIADLEKKGYTKEGINHLLGLNDFRRKNRFVRFCKGLARAQQAFKQKILNVIY